MSRFVDFAFAQVAVTVPVVGLVTIYNLYGDQLFGRLGDPLYFFRVKFYEANFLTKIARLVVHFGAVINLWLVVVLLYPDQDRHLSEVGGPFVVTGVTLELGFAVVAESLGLIIPNVFILTILLHFTVKEAFTVLNVMKVP